MRWSAAAGPTRRCGRHQGGGAGTKSTGLQLAPPEPHRYSSRHSCSLTTALQPSDNAPRSRAKSPRHAVGGACRHCNCEHDRCATGRSRGQPGFAAEVARGVAVPPFAAAATTTLAGAGPKVMARDAPTRRSLGSPAAAGGLAASPRVPPAAPPAPARAGGLFATPVMRADLTFNDAALEAEFAKLQTARSHVMGKQVGPAGRWGRPAGGRAGGAGSAGGCAGVWGVLRQVCWWRWVRRRVWL